MTEPGENLFFDLRRLKYLGAGAIVGKMVRIRKPEETIIGDYSIIDDFTYISSAVEIGRYCHIAPNVTISGGAGRLRTGDFCGIAAGCSIHTASSDYLTASFELPSIPEEHRFGGEIGDVVFEDHALLGAHSVVLPGVRLPRGFACGALTVVRHSLRYQPWTFYVGVDCKRIALRDHPGVLEGAAALAR